MKPQQLTKMTPQQLAKALGGDFNNGWLNIPGPGHSKNDRSLGIRLDPSTPDGFRVHSLADDDPKVCVAYVKTLLLQLAKNGSICLDLDDNANLKPKANRTEAAFWLWQEAQPVEGTLASAYLKSRKCAPRSGEKWSSELRFHPACPFGPNKFPALVAAMRNVSSGEFTGIHRTALSDDGSSKREMPDGLSAKMMMGTAAGAAIQLHSPGARIGLAERIETALSAHKIFKMPVWAAMSALGIREFPVILGVKFLRILSDHDEVGLSAARHCRHCYELAGTKVEIRYPQDPGTDWNDYLRKEYP